jgi:hypothetical protein
MQLPAETSSAAPQDSGRRGCARVRADRQADNPAATHLYPRPITEISKVSNISENSGMLSWFLIGPAKFHLLILASLVTVISIASQKEGHNEKYWSNFRFEIFPKVIDGRI